MSILNDYTRFTWIFPLTSKSNTWSTFISFNNMIENSLNRKIKCLQTDWGVNLSLCSPIFQKKAFNLNIYVPTFITKIGKLRENTDKTGLTLLSQAHLPLKFWWNAFHTATYLISRLSTSIFNNKSPFKILFHKILDYIVIRVFGCFCYP